MSVTVYYQHITKEHIKGKCSLEEWIAFKARPKGIGRLYKEIGRNATAVNSPTFDSTIPQ